MNALTLKSNKIFSGVGVGMIIVIGIAGLYYNIIIAWTLYYLGSSFMSPLPWRSCDNEWNTDGCITDRAEASSNSTNISVTLNTTLLGLTGSSYNMTNMVTGLVNASDAITSEEEFWQ